VRGYLQGLLEGVVPPGVDLELAAHALVAALEYFGRMLVEDPDRFEPDRLVAFAAGILRLEQQSTT
jgi:hypothetical protein